MSRQSLAVKPSGALIGTVPLATTSPPTFIVTFSEPPGLGHDIARLDFDLRLSGVELAAIWRAADPQTDYGRIIRLSILSAQRIGQWAAIRREYVGTDTITWPAEIMKGKRSHTLSLTPAIRTLLPDRIGFLFSHRQWLAVLKLVAHQAPARQR
jgi:hypothetical protein